MCAQAACRSARNNAFNGSQACHGDSPCAPGLLPEVELVSSDSVVSTLRLSVEMIWRRDASPVRKKR